MEQKILDYRTKARRHLHGGGDGRFGEEHRGLKAGLYSEKTD